MTLVVDRLGDRRLRLVNGTFVSSYRQGVPTVDPTAAVAHIREHIASARQAEKAGKVEDELLELNAVAEHFEGLDGWLSKLGFPPAQWRASGVAADVAVVAEDPATTKSREVAQALLDSLDASHSYDARTGAERMADLLLGYEWNVPT